jgi:hypothetical protein
MKASVLIAGTLLLAALLAADAAHAACTTVNGRLDISASVMSLPPGYNPVPAPNAAASVPKCERPDAQNAPAIQQAFSLAPPGLQKDLCNLACIFVITDAGRHSWGKWANPDYQGSGEAVIGVHKNDINKKLSVKMKDHLRGIRTGTYTVDKDSPAIALMHTLAHEMAHIKWRRDVKQNISEKCPVATFIDKSWSDSGDARTRRWTAVTDEFGTRKNNIPAPSQVLAGKRDLRDIYQRGVATAMGANNAEEDFAETYSLAVLMQQFTQIDVKIRISSGRSITIPVNNDRGDQDLRDKLECVYPLLQ